MFFSFNRKDTDASKAVETVTLASASKLLLLILLQMSISCQCTRTFRKTLFIVLVEGTYISPCVKLVVNI